MMTVQEYLRTSFEDGDREYVDRQILERNVGDYEHSRLQALLIGHLAAFKSPLRIEVLPACRTRVSETHYRVPNISVMVRPFSGRGTLPFSTPDLFEQLLLATSE